jgi:uncharacterized membrane protein
VGSNTFLISERTMNGDKTPNRLKLIERYTEEGGGFLMWGGYLFFTGFAGKGFYKRTPIEKILPVSLMETDDRVEVPEGFLPATADSEGYIAEKKKGNVKEIEPRGIKEFKLYAGYLDKKEALKMEDSINQIMSK